MAKALLALGLLTWLVTALAGPVKETATKVQQSSTRYDNILK